MRFLILNFRDIKHPHAGGSERNGHILSKQLVEKGHEVTFFCSAYSGLKSEEIFEGVKYIRKGNLYTVYLWCFWLYLFKFRKKIDCILEGINGIPWFTIFYSRKPRALLLHHVHQKVFFYQLPWYVAIFASLAEKSLILFYRWTTVLTVSPQMVNELVRFGLLRKNINLVYNGIDEGFKVLNKQKTPLLVSVGRVRAYKRLDLLINAFEKVLVEIPTSKLIIIGAGDDLENIRELVKEKNLEASINLTGFISDEEKKKILGESWVYCITSSEEGWGIGVIEANASGCPTVAFSVGGLKDSVKDGSTGYLVPFGDVSLFSSKVVSLLKDAKLRSKMSKECINWSKQFTWKNWTNKIEEVLLEEYKRKN